MIIPDPLQAVKIALNKTKHFRHGWYCVRNRNTEEILSDTIIEQRDLKERTFFEEHSEWSAVPESRRGVASLKKALHYLLSEHIAKEFPVIRTEINEKLEKAKNDLAGLGPSRQTSREQMQYLVSLALSYQAKVEDALNGRYPANASILSKLRARVQNANDDFNDEIHKYGHLFTFQPRAIISHSHSNHSSSTPDQLPSTTSPPSKQEPTTNLHFPRVVKEDDLDSTFQKIKGSPEVSENTSFHMHFSN